MDPSIAGFLAALLGILSLLSRRRDVRIRQCTERSDEGQLSTPRSQEGTVPDSHRPDPIARGARAIVHWHARIGRAVGVLIVPVVLVDAMLDPLVRYLVLATVGTMLLICLVALLHSRSNRQRREA